MKRFLFENKLMKSEIKSHQARLGFLTVQNPKTLKGLKKQYLPAVLMLAPDSLSGKNVCLYSSPGCRRACLNTSGYGGIVKGGAKTPMEALEKSNSVQRARIMRTNFLLSKSRGITSAPNVAHEFADRLVADIALHIRFCVEHDLKPCVRLNGTSDLRWEAMPIHARKNIMRLFPDLQFYDYTKFPFDQRQDLPDNYYLVYSLSDRPKSATEAEKWMRQGHNVAVVFNVGRNDPLPSKYAKCDVIDGDISDLRFLDPPGVVVGLRAKGFAALDTSGFVVPANLRNPSTQIALDFSGGSLFPDLEE